jgi:hypothetical protein
VGNRLSREHIKRAMCILIIRKNFYAIYWFYFPVLLSLPVVDFSIVLLKDKQYGETLMFPNDVKFSNTYFYFEYILPKEDG